MLLEIKEISFSYFKNIEILKKASFYVDKGEVVAIVGPNGSGKTTLLMIATGLLEPNQGLVLLNQQSLKEQLPEARKRIGLVFQEPEDQLFNPTVYDEIAFTLRQFMATKEDVDRRVIEIAKKYNLQNILNQPPFRLSIGEKRRVTLASVLAYNPEILVLDEPTANLSTKSIEEVEKIVIEAKKAGKAVIITSHDVEFVARVAERVYILNNGIIFGGLNVKSVLTNESLLELADMRPPLAFQIAKLLKLQKAPLNLEELAKTQTS